MRETKFRAWIKDEKKMSEVLDLDFEQKTLLIPVVGDKNGAVAQWLTWGDVELMQFTGLYDKNGKEIFEGDIVTCYLAYTNVNGVVEWDEQYCSWGIRVIPQKNDRFTLPKSYWIGKHTKLEILGNIYENTDLLEVGM